MSDIELSSRNSNTQVLLTCGRPESEPAPKNKYGKVSRLGWLQAWAAEHNSTSREKWFVITWGEQVGSSEIRYLALARRLTAREKAAAARLADKQNSAVEDSSS